MPYNCPVFLSKRKKITRSFRGKRTCKAQTFSKFKEIIHPHPDEHQDYLTSFIYIQFVDPSFHSHRISDVVTLVHSLLASLHITLFTHSASLFFETRIHVFTQRPRLPLLAVGLYSCRYRSLSLGKLVRHSSVESACFLTLTGSVKLEEKTGNCCRARLYMWLTVNLYWTFRHALSWRCCYL